MLDPAEDMVTDVERMADARPTINDLSIGNHTRETDAKRAFTPNILLHSSTSDICRGSDQRGRRRAILLLEQGPGDT